MNKQLVSLILFCFFYTMAHGQTDTLPLACIKEVGRYYQTNSLNALLPVPMGDCLRQHAKTVANGPFSDEWKIKALFYLANDLSAEGEWYNAEKIYTKALQLMDVLGYQDDGLKAEMLSSAGINYTSLFEVERGLAYARQALAFFARSGMKAAEAAEWINLGTSYIGEGDADEAQSCSDKAQEILGNLVMTSEDSITFWASQNLLGLLLVLKAQLETAQTGKMAVETFQKAHHVFLEAILALEKYPPNHNTFPALTLLYTNISTVFLILGEAGKVEEYLEKNRGLVAVLEQQRQLPMHFLVFQKMNESFVFFYKGDLAKAFDLVAEAQNMCGYKIDSIFHNPPVQEESAMPNPLLFVQTQIIKTQLFQAAFGQTQDKKYVTAYFEAYKVMADWLSLFRRKMASDEVIARMNNRFGNAFSATAFAANSMYVRSNASEHKAEAFRYIELDKSYTLRQAVSKREYLQNAPLAEQLLWKKDSTMKDEIRSLMDNSPSSPELKVLLEKHRLFLEGLETSELQRERAYFQNRISDNIPSIAEVQEKIIEDEHTALLEYTVGFQDLLVMVITKDTSLLLSLPWSHERYQMAKGMATSVNEFQDEVFGDLSSQLYDSIMAPALKLLPATINRLIIIPDGVLREVPFAALLTERPGEEGGWANMQWLIKRYAISIEYSAAIAVLTKKVKRTDFSPPRFAAFTAEGHGQKGDSTRCDNLGSLPELIEAAFSIKAFFEKKGWETSLIKDAIAKDFVDKANNNTVALLAMHGCSGNGTDSSYYHFVFSDMANKGRYDKLGLPEITALDLSNILMLVAGSCVSAAGQLEQGEGLISLSRALSIAGCGSLVATLHYVQPRTTAAILKKFHQLLLEEILQKDVALQQAMLDYLATDGNPKAPFYWANIICIGDRSGLGH